MLVGIIYKGIELYVKGTYHPEEKEIRFGDDMGGYPGIAEAFDISKVSVEEVNIISLVEEHLDEIEKLVLEQLKE